MLSVSLHLTQSAKSGKKALGYSQRRQLRTVMPEWLSVLLRCRLQSIFCGRCRSLVNKCRPLNSPFAFLRYLCWLFRNSTAWKTLRDCLWQFFPGGFPLFWSFKVAEGKNLLCPAMLFTSWPCYLGFYHTCSFNLPLMSSPPPSFPNCASKRYSSRSLPSTRPSVLFFLEGAEFVRFPSLWGFQRSV